MVLHASSVLILAAVGSVAALVATAIITFRYRDQESAPWLLASAGVACLWSAAAFIGLFVETEAHFEWINFIGWLSLTALPVAWFGFVSEYTGRRYLNDGRFFFAVAAIPAATIGMLVVEQLSGPDVVRSDVWATDVSGVTVITADLGVWGLFQAVYSFLLLGIALVLLVEQMLSSHEVYRIQAGMLSLATGIPGMIALAGLFDITPFGGADLTPFSFGLTGVLLLVAITHYDVLTTKPVPFYLTHNTILQSLETPLVVVNDSDVVVHSNPVADRLLADDSNLRGVGVTELPGISPTSDDGFVADDAVELTGPDGHHTFVTRTTYLEDERGQRHGSVLWYQDMTGVRQREQRLNVLNRVLRHDIRNEMNVILGQAQSGTDGAVELSEALTAIERTAQSVVDLSETARDIERLINIAPSLEPDGTVQEALESIHTRITREHPGASLTTTLDVTADTVVPAGFQEILWQLVDNGIRHNPTPTASVTITADRDPDGMLRCEVHDDGPGIPANELAVFDSGEETSLDHASGLGLWLVHWVVTEFGGAVHVESTDDGTVVTVTIPEPEAPSIAD